MADLTNLLQNRMFLQFLSAGGQDIAAGEPIGKRVGEATQQNIQAQSFAGLLSKILAGGGDFKLDKDKFTLSGAPNILGESSETVGGPSELGPVGVNPPGKVTPSQPGAGLDISQANLLSTFLNPSDSPLGDISPSDLAGLTTQDIGSIVGFKLAREELVRKRAADVAGLPLVEAKTQLALAQAAKAGIPKDQRTAAIKNYEFAQTQGFKGSFTDFKNATETTHKKDYDTAVEGGYTGTFHEWMLEMAKAGAINLGEVVARKGALEDIEAVKYFTDPKGLTRDIDKFISSDDVQNQLIQLEGPEVDRKKAQLTENFITGKIASAGGVILDSKLDGRTFVWTVKWPDGTTSEVRHAN